MPPPEIPEGLEHMLPLFIAEMVKDAARLVDLARGVPANGSLDDLSDHAHAMRGKAGMFGEHCLYDLLTEFEQLVRAGEVISASGLAIKADLVARVVERTGQLELYGREIAARQA